MSKKGGTTAIVCGDKVDSHTMEKLLRDRNVIGSGRGEVIRIAPHFYTKPEEIDYALDCIKDILEEGRCLLCTSAKYRGNVFPRSRMST